MDEHLSARNMDIPPPISPEAGKEAVEGVGEVGAAGWRAVKDTSSRIAGNVKEAVDCAKDAVGSAKDAAVDVAKESDAGLVGWFSENWSGIFKGLVTTFIITGRVSNPGIMVVSGFLLNTQIKIQKPLNMRNMQPSTFTSFSIFLFFGYGFFSEERNDTSDPFFHDHDIFIAYSNL